MSEWNVVVSVHEHCYRKVRELLRKFGSVERTEYYNVLALHVDDVRRFLVALQEAAAEDAALSACLARVIPVTHTFHFQSAEEFENRAKQAASDFLGDLTGKRFYVRMHRRGFHGKLSSQTEEQFLDRFLLDSLRQTESAAHVTFTDADAVLAVETIGSWAGLSLWKRRDLERYPFLRLN